MFASPIPIHLMSSDREAEVGFGSTTEPILVILHPVSPWLSSHLTGRQQARQPLGVLGRRRATVLVATIATLASVAAPAAATAENIPLPNWPALLPPDPGDSPSTVSLAWDVCPRGRLACPRRVIDEMKERWRPLDESCDHRAVFALTYLRTTQEYYRTVRNQPDFFSDQAWINHEDAVFAELYFRAYDRYERGRPVPAAWRIAFDTAGSDNEQALGDVLLGMNAHINRDLPYALAHVGLVTPDGSSRKRDHDRVNLFLQRVVDPIQDELARRYDPLLARLDAEPSPLDEIGFLEMVRSWRENAWRNAERLVNASSPAQLDVVRRSIETESALGARTIQALYTLPGYGARRDAYCAAAH
jgi:hypothetical protein